MSVVACEIPVQSVLDRGLIEGAFYRDAYRAPLSLSRAGVVEIFFAVFGHHPTWMKLVLLLRHRLASCVGLEVPSTAEVMRPQVKAIYAVGEKIGPWPVFHLGATELVAGRNNRHLDFRLSVLKRSGTKALVRSSSPRSARPTTRSGGPIYGSSSRSTDGVYGGSWRVPWLKAGCKVHDGPQALP
jgi:hypothetical protein